MDSKVLDLIKKTYDNEKRVRALKLVALDTESMVRKGVVKTENQKQY